MGAKRPNAEERRLARVRALRAQHFPEPVSVEEDLAEKDRRIVKLEKEVELLRLRISQARKVPESPPASQRHQSDVC